jgi:hypothetical protein
MARIRSIKPEFWSSPGIEAIDPYARLLYIAMWNWADDSGVGVANPRELLGFAFPLEEDINLADLRRMLEEIRRVFGVDFYTVAGRQYYSIPSWERHQKFDRRSKGKYPGPEEAEDVETPANKGNFANSAESHESPSSPRSDSVAGTGEQGNRGTGELVKDLSGKPNEFDQWYAAYPRKDSRGAAEKAFPKALKAVGIEALIAGATRYRNDPNREEKFTKLPATWLNNTCWEDGPMPAKSGSSKPTTGDKMRDTMARGQALQDRMNNTAGQTILEIGA